MIATRKPRGHSAVAPPSRSAAAKKIGGSAWLVAAMMVVNAVNFGINIWLASVLAPETFGDISLMVTLLLVTGVFASALQLTTSVAVLDPARDAIRDLQNMRLLTNRIGMGGAVALLVAAPQLTELLKVESAWALAIMALGLPVHLQLAVERGRLHGEMAFGKLTKTLLTEGLARALATCVVVVFFGGLVGLTVALNVGFVVSYAVCRPRLGRWSWCDVSSPAGHPPIRSVGVGLIAVTALTNFDLIIAKVAFDPVTAGGFAALTLAGRIVFFGSWTIQQAVLPFVTASNAASTAVVRRRAFIGGNLVLCAALVVGAWVSGELWVGLTAGTDFDDLAYLVGPYALGTAFIAIVAGIAMLASVGGDSRPATVLLIGVAVLGIVLAMSAGSLDSFVIARTVALGVLLLTAWGLPVGRLVVAQRQRPLCRLNRRGKTT